MLLDSNIFIYAVLPEHNLLRHWCVKQKISASDITRLEVLGYHSLDKDDREGLILMFELAHIYPITSSIIDRAIVLRQQQSISLGDSMIAATALEHKETLVTRNIKDFSWIEALKIFNPLANFDQNTSTY